MIESYNQLPIGKYLEITAVLADTSLGEVDRQVRLLSILSGQSEDELLNMPITDFADIARHARFLDSAPEVTAEAHDVYEAGDFLLMPVKDVRKMTTAQYIDFQTFGKDAAKHTVEMLSCLLVPEGRRYNDGYDILEVQAAIRGHLDCVSALGVYAFFFESLRSSMLSSLTSSAREVRTAPLEETEKRKALTAIRKAKAALRAVGGGSPASTGSRKRAGANGKKSGR